MALCVRSVSNKIVLFNGVVSSRNNTSKIPIRRSQFLEDFLSSRSSCSYQIAHKNKKENFFDDCLLPKEGNSYTKEFVNQPHNNISSNATWQIQTIESGKEKLNVRVKKYTPTQDDIILWSAHTNVLATMNNNLYNDLRLPNLRQLPSQWPDTDDPLDKQMVLLSSPVVLSNNTDLSSAGTNEDDKKGPDESRLKELHENLSQMLPKLFSHQMDYTVYHRDIVLINNIKGKKSVGLQNYVKEVALLRFISHLRFAYVKLEVLKITYHVEDSTIRARWRIVGVGALKVMLMFWRFRFWDMNKNISQQGIWYDGISTFCVGPDGLIHTHIIDKMMPDDTPVINDKASLAAKLALLLGLVPRSGWADACSLLTTMTSFHKDPGLCKLEFPTPKMK